MRSLIYCMLLIAPGLLPYDVRAGKGPGHAGGLEPVLRADTTLPFTGQRDTRIASSMVYFHLACLSARLKLYPLAMKLFSRAAAGRKKKSNDLPAGAAAIAPWHITATEDSLLALPEKAAVESAAEKMSSVLDAFRDTANADQYALILLVKQPVFNHRKVFTGIGNVGHTFITLIRFNRDNTYVSRSFGFYPKKKYPLAASPVFPATPGLFRNDAGHDWDELAGRFITKTQFRAIISMMESWSAKRYHLDKNNCTDFGLTIAALGGISVRETASHWPLGYGNNPATTGQSMLAGKVTSSNGEADLFTGIHDAGALWKGPVK